MFEAHLNTELRRSFKHHWRPSICQL